MEKISIKKGMTPLSPAEYEAFKKTASYWDLKKYRTLVLGVKASPSGWCRGSNPYVKTYGLG